MTQPQGDFPDLTRLRGVVAPEVLAAAEVASAKLLEASVPHALAGGLAVGAHGYPRTTDDVDFLVGDEAFVRHPGGLVTLRVPLIAVGRVAVDFLSIDESREREQLRSALEDPQKSGGIPVVPLNALLYLKLKAGRQRDIADIVELVKRGRVELDEVDRYLARHAPLLLPRWEKAKQAAAEEE